ncbi:MFS general substrate transporter, partial [Aureobasidium melanogenum]
MIHHRQRAPTSRVDEQISRNAQYGFIISPLLAMDDATLLKHAEDFHRRKGLEEVVDLETIQQGARLAKSREALERHYRKMTDKEKTELDSEESGEMRSLTKSLRVLLFTCAIAAIVQGWSQESIVGANLEWPQDLRIATKIDNEPTEYIKDGLRYFGIVNAMPYFAASVLGAWVSDPITYVYGRRTALFFAAICSFAAPIGSAYCKTWYQLLACRLIQGVGMGAKASVVPVIESEVAPPKLRGRLLVSWQTFVAVGIFLGAVANLIFNGHWRWQIGIGFVPAVPLLCLCYVIPESPRWLMRKQQYSKAYLGFLELRATPLQAARDLFMIYVQSRVEALLSLGIEVTTATLSRDLDEDTKPYAKPDWGFREFFFRVHEFFSNIFRLFRDGRNRRAVVASSVVMIAQQFSGINVFAFLATTVLDSSSKTSTPTHTLAMALGFAASNAIFSPLAYFLIDRIGRRALLLTSLLSMLPFLLLTGHYLDTDSTGAAITLIIIYTALYSPGAGVIPFMYSSEVYPQEYREVGMSLAVAINLSFAGALAMAVPQYQKRLSDSAQNNQHLVLLGSFAALDLAAAILVWLFMRYPERAVELEDMNVRIVSKSFLAKAYLG